MAKRKKYNYGSDEEPILGQGEEEGAEETSAEPEAPAPAPEPAPVVTPEPAPEPAPVVAPPAPAPAPAVVTPPAPEVKPAPKAVVHVDYRYGQFFNHPEYGRVQVVSIPRNGKFNIRIAGTRKVIPYTAA